MSKIVRGAAVAPLFFTHSRKGDYIGSKRRPIWEVRIGVRNAAAGNLRQSDLRDASEPLELFSMGLRSSQRGRRIVYRFGICRSAETLI